MKEALIIFAKNPETGKVKTRLAATIGVEAALAVYLRLLSYTASVVSDLEMDKFVFYSDQIIHHDTWNEAVFYKEKQEGSDLGERMEHAFENLFKRSYRKIVIIGTDCPEITAGIIKDAFTSLDTQEVVIGPAGDGGYYLLGMKQTHVSLFHNMPWSTHTVLKETKERCQAFNIDVKLLPLLNDIDEEKDLIYLKKPLE